MNMLDRIKAGVAEHATVPSAAVQLLHNLAEQIRTVANNPAAAEQLADLVHREAAALSAHVLANTPVIAATPPVHPLPAEHAAEHSADASTSAQHHDDLTA